MPRKKQRSGGGAKKGAEVETQSEEVPIRTRRQTQQFQKAQQSIEVVEAEKPVSEQPHEDAPAQAVKIVESEEKPVETVQIDEQESMTEFEPEVESPLPVMSPPSSTGSNVGEVKISMGFQDAFANSLRQFLQPPVHLDTIPSTSNSPIEIDQEPQQSDNEIKPENPPNSEQQPVKAEVVVELMEVDPMLCPEEKVEETVLEIDIKPELEEIECETVETEFIPITDQLDEFPEFKFEKLGATEEVVDDISVAIDRIQLNNTIEKEEMTKEEENGSSPVLDQIQPVKEVDNKGMMTDPDQSKDDDDEDDAPNIRRSSRIKTISKSKQKSRGHGLVRDREKMKLDEMGGGGDSVRTTPIKVKHRWMLEMQENGETIENPEDDKTRISEDFSKSVQEIVKSKPEPVDGLIEERLKQFLTIKENIYHCEKNISKEAKKMVCDCFLTSDEKESGELGCGEDCLNRLLMIECGSRCNVGHRCTNRRFQKFQYSSCTVVRTELKGFGIMATKPIYPGEFVMEYVGEVLNAKQFEKRANAYSKDKNKHYYFMALRSDAVIDATRKGNISRFINHSCDPNAETQKWTVNGELRIGFFSKRMILADEEITFDYQYQRYGKEAQKCFCESENCRGWIGEEPASESDADDEESELDEEQEETSSISSEEDVSPELDQSGQKEDKAVEVKTRERKEPKKRKSPKEVSLVKKKEPKERKTIRRPYRKRRQEILDDLDLDAEIENLMQTGLKNQAHTLKLSRLLVRAKLPETRSRLLSVLRRGEMPCRRLFLDYHGLKLLHGWMTEISALGFRKEILDTLSSLPIPNQTMLKDSNVLTTVASWGRIQLEDDSVKETTVKEKVDGIQDEAETEKQALEQAVKQAINALTKELIEKWIHLPEVFRIPKKERIEQMKEHEREADQRYMALGLHNEDENQAESNRYKNRQKPDEFPKKEFKKDAHRASKLDNMSKNQRRRLFAMQAEKQQIEKKRMDAWTFHEFRCGFFGLDPFRQRPEDVPSWVDLETGQWFSYDLTEVQTPANYSHIAIRPKEPESAKPEDYNLPDLDLPEGWEFSLDNKGRLYYYHKKIRIPQWEQPIKILPLSEGAKKETLPEAMQVLDVGYDDLNNGQDSSTTDTCDSSEEELVRKINRIKKLQQLGVPHSTIVKLSLHERNSDDETTKEEVGKAEARLTGGQKMPNREGLVEFREISPRRDEDRLYGQMEMKRYKETKEMFRRRKEMLKRRKLDRLKKEGLIGADPDRRISFRSIQITNDELYDETEDEDEVLVNGELVKRTTVDTNVDESLLKTSSRSTKTEDDGSGMLLADPLIEKIVLGNSRVDELDEPLKYNEMTRLKLREKKAKRKRALKVQMKLKKLKSRDETTINGTSMPSQHVPVDHSSVNGIVAEPLSSTQVKRIKDKFRANIAGVIVQHLSPYRRDACKVGRITSVEDFKHLARKLTHFVLLKELKQCQVADLSVTDSVKQKSREFIRKYMTKYGEVYQKPENEPDY